MVVDTIIEVNNERGVPMVMLQEAPAIEVGLSMEDFIAQFHKAPFELINDKRKLLMPVLPAHGVVTKLLNRLLEALEQSASVVVSKNDQYSDVNEKVEAYLTDGVQLVWVFDPHTRTVTVRTAGSAQATILHEDDRFDGGSVVKGFSVRIADVFAGKV
jgi:6-phosphogluconate dehydrogenase (decarboxylating)